MRPQRDLGLIVRYDGTDYHGFQSQANAPTVQSTLEGVFWRLLGAGQVIGAGRTDTGVHADAQVVVWRGPVSIPLERLPMVLNGRLPIDIRVLQAFWVPIGWDPRRKAAFKQYSYRLWRAAVLPPFGVSRIVYEVSRPLNWGVLRESARLFEGSHDFRAFRSEGSSAHTTIRTILSSRWVMEEQGKVWRYQVIGNGFLYHMVRHMVGGMLKAALPGGTMGLIENGLAASGAKVSALAPARGLTLDWIQFMEGADSGVSGSGIGIGR